MIHPKTKRRTAITAAAGAAAIGLSFAVAQPSFGSQNPGSVTPGSSGGSIVLTGAKSGTTTPIQHVVVLFDENVSFDHYFGTYPNATNTDGTTFTAKSNTPTVNGLTTSLLQNNANGANPTRLTSSQALTCDQDHSDTPEQLAYDNGLADKFTTYTQNATCSSPDTGVPGLVMDYYDGNTVTGLWNYAQNYAMSDENYGTTYGPSTPGAINLISGQTYGASVVNASTGAAVSDSAVVASANSSNVGTDIADMDPYYDQCGAGTNRLKLTGQNIGDQLNAKNVTWGWFQGGFGATTPATSTTSAVCGSTHTNIGGATVSDYSAHHDPFQYYASTANAAHTAPASAAEVGHNGQANHQYDLSYFYNSIKDGNLPSVSYVKQAEYQDGHAGYSDPTDEQAGIVNTINAIEKSKYWSNTAIIVTYDDSDGWYDHQAPVIVNGSNTAADQPICSSAAMPLGSFPDRCGFSQRLPLLVISPWTRQNFVSHKLTDTASVTRFIEDNWLFGKRIGGGSYDAVSGSLNSLFSFLAPLNFREVILDPTTGKVVSS